METNETIYLTETEKDRCIKNATIVDEIYGGRKDTQYGLAGNLNISPSIIGETTQRLGYESGTIKSRPVTIRPEKFYFLKDYDFEQMLIAKGIRY